MPKETDWYPGIVDLATQHGWLVHHTRAALRQSGKWSTPIMGRRGYPDFTFCHPARGVVMFREVKGPRTTVDPDQKIWLAGLQTCGVDVDIWRMPKDWERAVTELTFGRGHVQDSML